MGQPYCLSNMYGSIDFLAPKVSLGSNEFIKCSSFYPKDRENEYYRSPAIPFNEVNQGIYLNEVFHKRNDGVHFRDREIRVLDPNFRFHIRRFYLALDAYLESPHPVMSATEILRGCAEGPTYAKKLKKIKLLSYLYSNGLDVLVKPADYSNIPVYLITDIGDIFNFSYLFHWEEECEDYKDGLIPISRISQSYIEVFKEKLRKLLPDDVKRIHPWEILLDVTSSSSTSLKDFSPSRQWKERGKKEGLTFSSQPLKGRRILVQIGPGNTRDTVVLPLNQVNTIRYIDAQVWEVLSHMPSHLMFKDPNHQMYILNEFWSNLYFFYCRDLQKEGLTKPRQLLIAILDVLEERYPYLDCFKYKGIYEGYTLLIDDQEVDLCRGHGLGMANALTTLMNIVLYHLTIDEIWLNNSLSGKVESLSYNDDFVVGFECREDMEEYYSVEDDVLTRYGLIRKPEKSFKGHKSFVFMETYFPSHLSRKNSYYRREILNTLLCTNIVHAKEYLNSLYPRVDRAMMESYLGEFISYFGYEFFPGEERLPYTLGGWIGYRVCGVSLDLKIYFDLDDTLYDARVYRAFKAHKTRVILQKKGLRKPYNPPIVNLLPLASDVKDSEFRRRYYLDSTESDMASTLENLMTSSGLNKLYWERRRLKRLEVFGSYPNIYDRLKAYELISSEYDDDFIAPLSLPHRKFIPIESDSIRPLDLYKLNTNKLMAGISGYTGLEFRDVYPSKYEGICFSRNKYHRFKDTHVLGNISWSFEYLPSGEVFLYDERLLPVLPLMSSGDEPEFLEAFDNPTAAWLAARSVGLSFIPYQIGKKTKFLKEKKEVYGRLLSLNEMNMLLFHKIDSPFIIKVLVDEDYILEISQDCLEFLDNLLERGLKEDEPPPPVEIQQEEELDRLPSIWDSEFHGSEVYQAGWYEIRSRMVNYDLYHSIERHGVSRAKEPTLELSLDGIFLAKRLGLTLRYEQGSTFLVYGTNGPGEEIEEDDQGFGSAIDDLFS